MVRRLKVLVLDEEIPYPTDTGKKTRTYNLVSRLCQTNSIDYLCYKSTSTGDHPLEIFKKHGIEVHPVESAKPPKRGMVFFLKLFKSIFSPLPFIVSEYYKSCYKDKMQELLRKKTYDLIHCEISPYAIFLDGYGHMRSIVVAHNVEAEIWQRYFETERNLLRKAYIWLQWKKVSRFEAKFLKKASACIAVSDKDAAYIKKNYGVRNAWVIPNGVDTTYFQTSTVEILRNNLVFTGSMDWRPNQDAVRFFLHEIWPQVKKNVPDAMFTVVGRDPPKWLHDCVKVMQGVELTGTVEDVRPYLRRAHLIVVPLRIGGGSRLKILEAMASGKAVVSTSVGAEGLEVRDREDIFLEDSPHAFAKSIVGLLRDDETRMRIEERGRWLVEGKYRWEVLAEKMEKIWMETAF